MIESEELGTREELVVGRKGSGGMSKWPTYIFIIKII